MTTSPSSVLEVRNALVTRFQGYVDAAGITDCPVTRGKPGRVIPYRFVAIGTTDQDGGVRRDINRVPYVQGSVDESYILRVIIWQSMPGGHELEDQVAATDAVWHIANVLDQGLRQGPAEFTLGDLVTCASFTGFDDDEYDDLGEGRAAQIVALLSVDARHR